MEYAGFSKRFLAAVIDGLILGTTYLVLLTLPVINNVIFIFFAFYYHFAFETSDMRGTPGKYFMKIALVNKAGDTLTFKECLIRFATSYLSSICFYIGYFIFFFTEKKQTLHDLLAQTYVISNPIIVEVSVWDTFVAQFNKHIRILKEKYL